jgi:hypothetical protein
LLARVADDDLALDAAFRPVALQDLGPHHLVLVAPGLELAEAWMGAERSSSSWIEKFTRLWQIIERATSRSKTTIDLAAE